MIQAPAWTAYRVPDTLLSDTEESVVGTQWHQNAISALADMLEEVARRRGATWGLCNQIALLGLLHEDGTAYDPCPDVMVLARPLPSGSMSSIHLHEAGTPLFIAEVASESTAGNDRGDKRQAYAAIGVPEYLLFDPDGGLLPGPILAWRLEAGVYVPWRAEADGAWHSTSLDVAFQPTRPYLGVRDRDGRQIELPRMVRERAERLEQQAEHLEQQLGAAERRAEHLEQQAAHLEQRAAHLEQRAAHLEQAQAEEARLRAELEEQLRQLRGE